MQIQHPLLTCPVKYAINKYYPLSIKNQILIKSMDYLILVYQWRKQ